MKTDSIAEQLEEIPALELVIVETKTNAEKILALFQKIRLLKQLKK